MHGLLSIDGAPPLSGTPPDEPIVRLVTANGLDSTSDLDAGNRHPLPRPTSPYAAGGIVRFPARSQWSSFLVRYLSPFLKRKQ